MATLKARLTKVEAQLSENRKARIEFAVICVDEPNAEERTHQAKQEYKTKYGSLSGLTIVHTRHPQPKPLPEAFKLQHRKRWE